LPKQPNQDTHILEEKEEKEEKEGNGPDTFIGIYESGLSKNGGQRWSLPVIHGLRDIRASCPSDRTTDTRIFNPYGLVADLY
jgi:hypothetical protein